MSALIPPQCSQTLLLLKRSQYSPPSNVRCRSLVERDLWNLEFKWLMDASDVAMQARPTNKVCLTEFAATNALIHVWFVVHAVMQPAVHGQIRSSAIRLGQVVVVNGEDVAVFQICEAAIVTPEQFLLTPHL
jgi:hypothetical protein